LDNQFPTHTAGDVTLPDGRSVWIKTLNAVERDEVQENCHFWAAEQILPLRPKGRYYAALVAEMEEMEPEEQAEYLAQTEFLFGSIRDRLDVKYEVPERPGRTDLEDEAYDKALDAWRVSVEKVAAARAAAERKFLADERTKALALTPKLRLDQCVIGFRKRKRRDKFMVRYNVEILARAVRSVEDHAVRVYDTPEKVSELDDATKQALLAQYFAFDNVSGAEIPTSADAS
jgi:hypothetical protein